MLEKEKSTRLKLLHSQEPGRKKGLDEGPE